MNEQVFLGGRPVVGFGDADISIANPIIARPLVGFLVGSVAGALVGTFVQKPIGTYLGTMVGGFGGLMVGAGLVNAEARLAAAKRWHRLQEGDVVKAGQQLAMAVANTDRTAFLPNEVATIDHDLTTVAQKLSTAPVQGAKDAVALYPPGATLPADWPIDDDLGAMAYRVQSNVLIDSPKDFVQRLNQMAATKLTVEAWVR